jgi:AraC family transcriptional regulator
VTLACGCPADGYLKRRAGEFSLVRSRYAPGCRAGVHDHPESRVVLSLDVGFASNYGRHRLGVEPGAMLYRPSGRMHADAYYEPATCVSILLPPRGRFAELPDSTEAFAVAGDALRSLASTFLRELDATDGAAELVLEGLAGEAVASAAYRRPIGGTGKPRWVSAIRERLDEQYLQPPSLDEIASDAGREGAYVCAAFRSVYGSTIGEYIRRLRIAYARRSIDRAPHVSLVDVAHECGFADQSHFGRHFKRSFGIAPGAYRRRRIGDRRATATSP